MHVDLSGCLRSRKGSSCVWAELTAWKVHVMVSEHPQTAEGQLNIRQLPWPCVASSFQQKVLTWTTVQSVEARPLVGSLRRGKWMYFAPFELRKVWCYSDVNWTPLSLSYSSGIPYPVNSLLAQTLNREFHNSLWSLTGANERTNDCTYVQFRKKTRFSPLLTFV